MVLSGYHRNTEWLELEDPSVQWPCHGQGHLQLAQVSQSPVQPGPEHCQGWGTHFFGQSIPESHHTHHKQFLPYIWCKSTSFDLKTLLLLLSLQDLSLCIFLVTLFMYWKATAGSPCGLVFSRLNSTATLSPALWWFSWPFSNGSNVLPAPGDPEQGAERQVVSPESSTGGTSFRLWPSCARGGDPGERVCF